MAKIMRIKPTEELTPVDFAIVNKARDLSDHMFDYFAQRSVPYLNSLIKKHGPLSQVHVATFFSEVAALITSNCVVEAKRQLERCEDGEHTLRSLFNDIISSCELRLGLKTVAEINNTPITINSKGIVNSPIKAKAVLSE
jgi:hypothetical protein